MSVIGSDEQEELGYILVQQETMWSEQGLSYKRNPAPYATILTVKQRHDRFPTTRTGKPYSPVATVTSDHQPQNRYSSCRVALSNVVLASSPYSLGGSAQASTNTECHRVAKLVWSSEPGRVLTLHFPSPRRLLPPKVGRPPPSPSKSSATLST